LFLVKLTGFSLSNDERNAINALLPNEDCVFADWFTGEIRLPYGEQLEYINQGYASIYEKDLILEIKKGLLVNTQEIDNHERYTKYKEDKDWTRISDVLFPEDGD